MNQAAPHPSPQVGSRILAIDVLRGLAVALMLMDHVREFFYLNHQVSDPMDIGSTDPLLFFTRLFSHFCAPVFIFLTGLGAWLYGRKREHPQREASAYLFNRGLFLVLLELTAINFAWSFSYPPSLFYLQVIWAIGVSMMALAVLLWLPWQALLAFGLVVVGGHNLLNGLHADASNWAHLPWAILHDRSVIELWPGWRIRTSYPVLPWIGVITLGYAAGQLYRDTVSPLTRQRVLGALGLLCVLGFVILRACNGYGDTQPWSHGSDGLHTLMSFLNVTKYPPSLLFLLLTLGLGLLALHALEKYGAQPLASLAVFGSVPLFFYLLHLYVLHLLNWLCAAMVGNDAGVHYSFSHVWQIWLVTAMLLPPLYWPCLLFARYKRRSKAVWASYL